MTAQAMSGGLKPRVPGLKQSESNKWLGISLATGGTPLGGGLLPFPPLMSRMTSDAFGITKPDVPKIPGTPQIDQARQMRQETDRIRRRRGVLANIFAGDSSSAAPATGTKQLLGG